MSEPLEERLQRHVDRPVHDQAERALVVVLADVGKGLGEVRIGHVGHGDQEVMREVTASYSTASAAR